MEQGFRIVSAEVPAERPAKEWMFLPALLLLATLSALLGTAVERWLFFAQARHPQNLYYQVVS